MPKRSRNWAFFIAGAVSGAALTILLGPSLSNSIAAGGAHKVAAHAVEPAGPSVPTMKIVPADVTGGVAPWAPLTGDGSN
jgi:hypothetical protein